MKLKEKISLEKVFEKEYKIKLAEPKSNKEAVITHYLHNNKNGVSQFFKNDAIKFTKEILQYKYPEEEITNIVAEEALQYGIFDTFNIPFLPIKNPKFKFIDLFAGIGGFRLAMQNLGGKCVFTSEWDKEAKRTYNANFLKNFNGLRFINQRKTLSTLLNFIKDNLGVTQMGRALRSNLFVRSSQKGFPLQSLTQNLA